MSYKKRFDKGKIKGPFVPMLLPTANTPAWKAMSAHARIAYIRSLRSRYSLDDRNNGRIYASSRTIADENGFNQKTAARCLRELAWYGFIVQTLAPHLGVEGKGKAAHWRLTELGYMGDPPTKDFERWNGELYREPSHRRKTESRTARRFRVNRPLVHSAEPPDGSGKPETEPPAGSYSTPRPEPPNGSYLELPSARSRPAPLYGIGHNAGPPLDAPTVEPKPTPNPSPDSSKPAAVLSDDDVKIIEARKQRQSLQERYK